MTLLFGTLLSALTWYEIVGLVVGGGAGLTTIIVLLIKWVRDRGIIAAEKTKKEAEAEKLYSEARKTNSEAHLNATNADISLAKEAMLYAQRLSKELEVVKSELADERISCQTLEDEITVAREALVRLDAQNRHMKEDIEKKDKRIAEMISENNELKTRLQELLNTNDKNEKP